MNKKGIPIGIDDFKMLRERQGYYIDKSLFIKEIIDDISVVKLITRPRRFGKTLNLSMLKYFFEKSTEDIRYLFQDLLIWRQGEVYLRHQGQYPVVNLTFKDVKENNYTDCLESLKIQISDEFKRHDYLLQSSRIRESDKKQFLSIIDETASPVRYKNSLSLLTKLLCQYYEKEVIVLIDEYDTPINQGYLSGYYDQIIDWMRVFLGGGLKGNSSLQTAVITGIYRVAKESIFSGFNNLKVCSLIDPLFTDKFGFTESETEALLTDYEMKIKMSVVKEWYNGYLFGDQTVIYNPWSVLNYVEQGKLCPYWVNTSSNDVIRQILSRSGGEVKRKLQCLMEGLEISDTIISTDTNFRDIQNRGPINENILWSLLLVSGYLKPETVRIEAGRTRCDLKLPNREIAVLYEDIIAGWFQTEDVTNDQIKELLLNLVEGKIEEFQKKFEYIIQKTFSYFDVGANTAENFYHAFILGMLVNLDGKYRVKSNAESGAGRPDVIIIPQNRTQKGVIIEFKVADGKGEEALRKKAAEALQQINAQNYAAEITDLGIKEVVELAVVFYRKKVHVDYYIRKIS